MNIGLSAVLVVLLLCEISNLLDPAARSKALGVCLPLLMLLLVFISPALQLQSVLAALGLNFASKGRTKLAWMVESIGLGIWLFGFWTIGDIALRTYLRAEDDFNPNQTFSEACLERIGVAGISLLACLSGFAAISAVWHTFIDRQKTVTDAEINKRQTGLAATEEMVQVKESRLRALEAKMSENTSNGLISSVISTLRTGSDTKERTLLQMELGGLRNVRNSLQNTLYALQSRKSVQEKARSTSGRALLAISNAFAIYCVFRLASIGYNIVRKLSISTGTPKPSQGTDPVTFLLGILAKHWDPTLDRDAYTRQISFLLSGVLLLAAFNSALQTFLLLARAFPRIAALAMGFREATTLALLISQVVATYVISSAIMMRSNLPKDVGSAIASAIGAPLEPRRVEAWFDAWFLIAAAFTTFGIWIGKRIYSSDEDEFSEIDKRS